jgi:hypothetical protein
MRVQEWTRCKQWIADGLEFSGGLYSIEDVERRIENGEMIFLPAEHCAVVLEFISYPRAKVLNVFSGGGSPRDAMKEYAEIVDPFIADFAKRNNCKLVMHHCRKSGERLGRALGYTHQWSIMLKEIK